MVKKKNLKGQLQVKSTDANAEAETETGDLFLILPGNGDWRSQLPPDFRQKMVNKIMEFLERHGPFLGPEPLLEIKEKAREFEEKSYTAATSQTDYLKKISLKMLAQSPMENGMQPTPGNITQNHANSGMPSNQQNVHVLQHSRVSAPQPLQQTGGSQHHTYTLQRDMHQRLQTSSSFLQKQNLMEPPQWQLFQPGQYLDAPSTTSTRTESSGVPVIIQENNDWSSQLHPDSRERIVNKIMETLKKHLPIYGPEGLLELKKIAVRFEENFYNTATSKSDYLKKISLKMLTMETKAKPSMDPADLASSDSTAQTGSVHGDDWQEEAYQKIRSMKEMYFAELNELYQRITSNLELEPATRTVLSGVAGISKSGDNTLADLSLDRKENT